MSSFSIPGNILDIEKRTITTGVVHVENGKIKEIQPGEIYTDNYILPGFIDSHIHIESSMLVPSEFARIAVTHGTVATVSDPHEIANVLGIDGVRFMINNGKKVPFKFYFGAPSCVPATTFESAGAAINLEDIRELFESGDVFYLSEMMNYPGVLYDFPDVIAKLELAKEYKLPIDGHAPGLIGNDAAKYASHGISTDHECFELPEAIEKIQNGVKIQIREGSAAKNFNSLSKLIDASPDMCMFCSDDRHPDDLIKGHINDIVKRAVDDGYDLWNILQAATLNPVKHYNLDLGLLRPGDDADFIVVDNLKDFTINQTYVKGIKVAENGKSLIDKIKVKTANNFSCEKKELKELKIKAKSEKIRVIEAIEGELITNEKIVEASIDNGFIVSDTDKDVLKLAVINRYSNTKPAIGFIKGFSLKSGAIATSVSHDSHNIIALGTNDEDLLQVINTLIESEGGLAVVDGENITKQTLPIAGLMSADNAEDVADKYAALDKAAKDLGSKLNAPFMTLSFMALLVIPSLKLSDKGLFDGNKFEFCNLFFED